MIKILIGCASNLPNSSTHKHNQMDAVIKWFNRVTDRTVEPIKAQEDAHYPVIIGETYYNRYTVVRTLGAGYSSRVWLCRDAQTTRFVALKILKNGLRFRELAMQEIKLLKCIGKCNGPHKDKVVQLLDYFNMSSGADTHVCMVFEVLGENLVQFVRRGLPSLTSVKIIIRQALEALEYLHTTCNIIHTDIKPENVCVVVDEEVYSVTVTDVGNACWVDRKFSKRIQTWPYRSPEVILGDDYEANADVWSAACTAFTLATGTYLFPASEVGVVISRNVSHLALIEELLGEIPREMAVSEEYFTDDGKLILCPKVRPYGLFKVLTRKYKWDAEEAREFSDFLLPMLAIDPTKRCSAKEALAHKWLQF